MRKFSIADFSSKKAAEQALLDVLNPLKPFYSESGARIHVGVTSTHYENDTIPMEAFARPLWGLVPFWTGGGSDAEFEELYRKGLEAGSDPSHPDYWHTCRDYDQKFCEMAAIAFGMLFCPEKVWEPLSERGKDNLVEWLWEINRHECCACNWQFFSIMTNVALYKAGRPYDKKRLQEGLDCIDAYYDTGGWYNDGNGGDKDYYNPFVMVTYGMVYARFMEKEDPERCRRFIERALTFGKDYIYWFSEDGSTFAYGRSMTYRFAQAAYFSVCVLCGVEVFPLPVLKGILARHLTHWLNLPIWDNADILTIGYAYPNLQMSESYNAPGSPYWAMKAFMFLGLPEDHPFWAAECAPLPELDERKYLEYAGMVLQRGKENVVALVPGRLVADGHSHTVEKYSKFAYSSKFGFSIMRSNVTLAECAPDSMLAFEAYGYFFVKDVIDPDFTVSEERLIFSWSPIKGIYVKTTIEPTKTGHIRTHEITSNVECKAYDGGFAVSTDDRKPYSRTENGDSSCVENEDGYCSVRAVEGDGEGQVLIPDPNTNLMASKTSIPMAVYAIRPGVQTIRTQVDYL
ncbi:MAG TPA: DUF2264 domain-containing protein [Candidatus Mediterraneibacter merdavium]|nr:DUF2264 domain-containing protein [Candidatus Mediterraneibacter merdavium]